MEILPRKYQSFYSSLADFVQQYAFINLDLWLGDPLTTKETVNTLKSLIALKDANQTLAGMHEHEQEREKISHKIISDIGFTGEQFKLIEFARDQFALKQYMRSVSLKAGLTARDFLTVIGKRVGLAYNNLLYMTPPEVIKALEGEEADAAGIQQRRERGYGLYLLDGKFEVRVGEELDKEIASAIGATPKDDIISGSVAYPGKYKGPVKIVSIRAEADKMRGGEVLVAPMTDPYLVPAMLRAGAIVTDEGGLLSHAAIISREQSIPCIVGTGKASKTLKDGDIVIVEAEGYKGTVKIIQKAYDD